MSFKFAFWAIGALVLSFGSWPLMTCKSNAASGTVQVKGPIWSRLLANATRP